MQVAPSSAKGLRQALSSRLGLDPLRARTGDRVPRPPDACPGFPGAWQIWHLRHRLPTNPEHDGQSQAPDEPCKHDPVDNHGTVFIPDEGLDQRKHIRSCIFQVDEVGSDLHCIHMAPRRDDAAYRLLLLLGLRVFNDANGCSQAQKDTLLWFTPASHAACPATWPVLNPGG